MKWFSDLKTSKKIYSLITVKSICLIIVGVVGFYAAQTLSADLTAMYKERLVPVQLMAEVRLTSKDSESKLLQLILTSDAAKQQTLTQAIQGNTDKINKLQEEYSKVDPDAYEAQKLAELDKELVAYRKARKSIIELATQGKSKEAYDLYVASIPTFSKATEIRSEIIEYNKKEASTLNDVGTAHANLVKMLTVSVTTVAFILAVIFGSLIAKMISNPLRALVQNVKEVAKGNLAPRSVIKAEDEIGQLGREFNAMTESLSHLVGRVIGTAEHLAAASEELTASADETAVAINQVANSINDVADGAERQLKAVETTAKFVDHMSSHVQQISENVNTVENDSNRAASAAQEGGKVIATVVQQMGIIEKAVQDSFVIVETLGNRSQEIGKIVDTISAIAGQTNLLALNAAIEAARAGEQGRGFAVVADEVRKLAEQSQQAAEQIASIVGEIQIETNKAVTSMDGGNKEVKAGTQVVEKAGTTFQEIATLVHQVSDQVKNISTSILAMSESNENIVDSVQAIDKISRGASEQTQTVSAATQEQSATMEEIASSSRALAKLAEELRQITGQFTV